MLQSTEYAPMKWDYFVNHYQDLSRQEKDSKMTWETTAGDLYVGANPPTGATPLGILYPRSGTLGGCTAHNALITVSTPGSKLVEETLTLIHRYIPTKAIGTTLLL